MNRARLVLFLVLLGFLAGCGSAPAPTSTLPTTTLRVGNVDYTVEIAATYESRATGLMKRDTMSDNHGMIFVFRDEAPQSFWMKDTRIPLDILYVAASGQIVSMHSMRPYVLSSVPSDAPAKWAIELNQGQVQRNGAKVGDVLIIPPAARDANE